MDFLASAFSSLVSVFVLAVFVAGVMKLFQIYNVLTEIKDNLRTSAAIRPVAPYAPVAAPSASPAAVPVGLHEMGSGEDMLRALDAQIKLDQLTGPRENADR